MPDFHLGLVHVVYSLEHHVALAHFGECLSPIFRFFILVLWRAAANSLCLQQRRVQLGDVAVEVLTISPLHKRMSFLGVCLGRAGVIWIHVL